jgi:glycosyltransferase involved in cell wall biosynthesis
MIRVLAITSVLPRNLHAGDKLYAHHLFEGLALLSELTVIGHEDAGSNDVTHRYRALESGRPRTALRVLSLFSRWPSSVFVNRSAALRKLIDDVIRDMEFDALVCDHLRMSWAGPYVDRERMHLGKRPLPCVLITQNVEAEVSRGAAKHERNPIKAAAMWLDAAKVRVLERRALSKFDEVTAISMSDASSFRTIYDRSSTVIMPGYTVEAGAPSCAAQARKRQAVLIGSFWSENKKANLLETIEHAAEVFPARGIRLKVVGSMPPGLHRMLVGRYSFLDVLGAVQDLRPHLDESSIGIVAEPRGGGFKLKALDYIFARLPMAVVNGSLDGISLVPHEEYLPYESIADLVRGVAKELEAPERLTSIGLAAYMRCEGAFSWQDRAQRLIRVIESCVARRSR